MTTMNQINDFLSVKSIAVAGVSRSGKKMGNGIFRELKTQNYQVYQINPNCAEIDGEKCYPNLKSIPDMPEAVITVLPKEKVDDVVKEASEIGIKKIWTNQSSVDAELGEICKKNGIDLIENECILMFANPKSFHKFHRFVNKLFGKLPK